MVIETLEIQESQTEKFVKKAILVTSLVLAIPLYLLILIFTDDPWLQPGESVGTSEAIEITALGGMDFSPADLEQITSTEELLENIVLTVDLPGKKPQTEIYLRACTYDSFTDSSMKSSARHRPDSEWPNFAFAGIPKLVMPDFRKAYLNFYRNFEERLPHPPVISKLAGPLKYCPMRDGSLMLDYTIAAADEFEVEFLDQETFSLNDEFDAFSNQSPFLSLDGLNKEGIRALAEKAAPVKVKIEAGSQFNLENVHDPALRKILVKYNPDLRLQEEENPEPETVFLLKKYLESTAIYTTKFVFKSDVHPVEEFLLTSPKGHCQLFAAGFVALCRSRGIPSRVGVGYHSNYSQNGKFVVTLAMAHAWPEILTKKGWKIVDLTPLKSEMPSLVKSDVKFPSDEQLKKFSEKKYREAAARSRGDAGGSGVKDQGALDRGPLPRRKNSSSDRDRFSSSGQPGSVIKDDARESDYLQRIRNNNFKKLVRFVLYLLLIGSFIIFVYKYAEDFFKWLIKMLKGNDKDEIAKEHEQKKATEEFNRLVENLDADELTGKDLAEIFASFTRIMAARSRFAREEFETVNEYLSRICLELNLRPIEGQRAAAFLESEVYGERKIDAESFMKFCEILKSILAKI